MSTAKMDIIPWHDLHRQVLQRQAAAHAASTAAAV